MPFSLIYADDDDLVREVLVQALTEEGLVVYACANGAEALVLCGELDPNAVLLDLNMPRLDGLEAAKTLSRTSSTRPRLVALTGRGTPEMRRKAIAAGFDAFLVKPSSVPAILEALGYR
ncbi:MAG TPA: response regulator [Rhodanobacteraceae bacterium]|nr:response regulator [Rhodanobacteraceae bacterium]